MDLPIQSSEQNAINTIILIVLTRLIKFKSERSNKKVMVTVFWDWKRIILKDFLKVSKLSQIYYESVLRNFKAAVIKEGKESCTKATYSITKTHLLLFNNCEGYR